MNNIPPNIDAQLRPVLPEMSVRDLDYSQLKQNGEYVETAAGTLFLFVNRMTITEPELQRAEMDLEKLVAFINNAGFPLNTTITPDFGTRKNEKVSLFTVAGIERSIIQPLRFLLGKKRLLLRSGGELVLTPDQKNAFTILELTANQVAGALRVESPKR